MPSQNKQRKVFWAIMCLKSTPRKSWEQCTASFLSKADLIHVVPRCNNSKNPLFCDMQHVQRVIPTRCASEKELFVKIQILFPLHAQTTQWFIWQAPKWEMQIGKECARCKARAEQISRKKRLLWKVRNRLNLKAERSLWWQRPFAMLFYRECAAAHWFTASVTRICTKRTTVWKNELHYVSPCTQLTKL